MMRARGAVSVMVALVLAACGDSGDAPGVEDARPAAALATALPARPGPAPVRQTTEDVLALVGLVPGEDDDVTAEIAAGLRAAFEAARSRGGPDIALRVAEKSERWAAEASAAVTLALDEGAIALVTPPDRRRAHVLAQVATKARVPVISTCPEASVMQAGSRWVMSVAPPDAASAEWADVGRAAGDAVVRAIEGNGLRRDGFLDAAQR